jgi:3-phenylpropionate/cinnamic acid dioxygenase small subunit
MSLSIEDRLLLHELVARLDHAVDAQDWDSYLAVFAEDATLDPGFAPAVSGLPAIRAFLQASEGGTRGKRHVASNLVTEGSGTEARVRSYLTVIEREDLPKVVATAVIEDQLVKRPEGWRVTAHTVRVDPGMFKAYAAAQAGGRAAAGSHE